MKNQDKDQSKQKHVPTNEERWVNDVNEEFMEDVPFIDEDKQKSEEKPKSNSTEWHKP